MKFLLISDAHGSIANLEKAQGECADCDAVIFAGDFTEYNKFDTTEPCVKKIRDMHENVFSVLGNCDKPELLERLEKEDMSCENTIAYFDGIAIAGSGGGSKFTGTTPNERTEEELLSDFDIITNSEKDLAEIQNPSATSSENLWNNLILVSHNPPKGTVCDQCAPGVHVGSQKLHDFIAEKKPLAVITGHIHEGVGKDKIGETLVINPGSLAEGNYALLEIEKSDGRWSVTNSELKRL